MQLSDKYGPTDDFGRFFDEYRPRLIAFARGYVRDRLVAEDLATDSFLYFWENRSRIDTGGNPAAYVLKTLRHKCLNHLRHKTIALETINNMQEEYNMTLRMNLDSLEAFEQHIFSDQDIEDLINRALDSLPTKCKEIFIMNKLEGKKQEQIATELNLSTNTVRNQISIAYKKLRNELKDYLPLWLFLFHCT